jgi:hypothetical protein
MGTRSRVAVMHGDVIKSVYCHFDGYLKHTGTMLHRYYDSIRANELVARGDNSGVQQSFGEMHFYAEQEEVEADWAVAHSLEEFLDQVSACGAEYYYVMRDGVWYAGCMYATEGLTKGGLTRLDEALADMLIAEAIAEDE